MGLIQLIVKIGTRFPKLSRKDCRVFFDSSCSYGLGSLVHDLKETDLIS